MINGKVVGSANVSSMSRASGIWTLNEAYDGVKTNAWPTIYEVLNFVTSGNLSLTYSIGNTSADIFKTSGSATWDNHAYIATGFTAPCTIEFNKNAGSTDNGSSYAMMAWNADPTANASYTSLDHASYPYATTLYEVYNNGTYIVPPVRNWSTSSKFYIVYDTDGFIRHYNGSTLMYSANYGTGNTVYVDSSFYSVSATFGGFTNIRVAKKSWDGTKYV